MAKNILVVDDEPSFCEVIRQFFEGKGYSVTKAYNGDEALASYREDRPDVVLLDFCMPGKNGPEVLRELKAFDPEANVMLVTAVVDKEVLEGAIAAGAFDYALKPLNLHSLDLALKLKFGQIGSE